MFPRLIFASLLVVACSQAPAVSVENAQIRALLPGRDTTAGYFTLHNHTDAQVTVLGASSPYARAIEMHSTVIVGDRVTMQRNDRHTLAPGESLQFEPGGHHLMLFGVSQFIEPFPITLLFSDGEQAEASFSKLLN